MKLVIGSIIELKAEYNENDSTDLWGVWDCSDMENHTLARIYCQRKYRPQCENLLLETTEDIET